MTIHTKALTFLFIILCTTGYAQEITIHAIIWERNGYSDVPDGLMGVHATPYSEKRVQDWGITQIRKIKYGPGGPTIVKGVERVEKKGKLIEKGIPSDIKYVVDCFFDRYQPALQVSNPGN